MNKNIFDTNAKKIKELHFRQTIEDFNFLTKKYTNNLLVGEVYVWDLVEKLSLVIDPTDRELYGVSQWIHTLQVLDGMEKDNIQDPEILLAGILHDVGKILLLFGELPENVVCDNDLLNKDAIGLNNCYFNWNHDEFAYLKFKNYVPDKISKIIRYHSIKMNILTNNNIMTNDDILFVENYLIPFRKWDKTTKSIYNIPNVDISYYKDLVFSFFPKKIKF